MKISQSSFIALQVLQIISKLNWLYMTQFLALGVKVWVSGKFKSFVEGSLNTKFQHYEISKYMEKSI
jgi:hypothetical protein